MTNTYYIDGMTCEACVVLVQEKLSKTNGVKQVEVNLESAAVKISMERKVPLGILNSALPEKYTISERGGQASNIDEEGAFEKTKLQQLKPLFLIFLYLFSATILLNFKDWNLSHAMLDFMGLFYIVFSFFKFLDLKGFPESFRMYDPVAKVFPAYGWAYPFIEVALGLMFLFRFGIRTALVVTLIILGITTFGVTKTLIDNKKIRCACLGTALKLPMTEATLIENAIMLIMSAAMLAKII